MTKKPPHYKTGFQVYPGALDSYFDNTVCHCARAAIGDAMLELVHKGKLSKSNLATFMGIPRNRVARLLKLLGMENAYKAQQRNQADSESELRKVLK